jgi:hypothetical protein
MGRRPYNPQRATALESGLAQIVRWVDHAAAIQVQLIPLQTVRKNLALKGKT